MAYVEFRNGYDSDLCETRGKVSKKKPIMAVVINEGPRGNYVADVVEGTQKSMDAYLKKNWPGIEVRDLRVKG